MHLIWKKHSRGRELSDEAEMTLTIISEMLIIVVVD